ncbi:hypothetical protein FHU40_004079 [Nocardioides soli]|uniref:RES domain-containing protein n=2 Tax=Nocardioides soli TaxID=1036020 RepID=A0A7W4VYR9_9ACTN|nr:hypothetical protein [Nocardioides soli]
MHVKHKRRYTFLVEDHSTAEGAGEIPLHAMPNAVSDSVHAGGLVVTLPKGSEWWRLRPHPATESYSIAAEIGTPPDKAARDNRMTPKGIGAFYGASTEKGARDEVAGYADPAHAASIGRFTTAVPLTVVDLRDVPTVPSLFDPALRHLRPYIEFLHGFVRDVREVADPGDFQNLDYIPTQVMAETMRYDLSADGVLWRSSKDPSVTSCVLFIPPEEVADGGHEGDKTRLVLDPTSIAYLPPPL